MSLISELSVPAVFRAIVALSIVAGGAAAGSQALAQGAPGPLPVSVAKPIKRQVTDKAEFTGRFEASGLVEVRAQVSGQLIEVAFRDGADVKKGDLLFKIDPRPYQNALDQAQATVATTRTRIDLTKADVDRAKDLLKTGNISDQVAQQRNQAYLEAQASLQSALAALATAKLNLEWTDVRSPIDGRIGRKLVTEGNLISAGAGATLLTTIVNTRPIYFYFDVDEQSFLRYVGYIRANLVDDADGGAPVKIALPNSDKFNIDGRIDFADNQLDQQTGTLRLRATIPNKDGALVSGVFGRLRMQASKPYDALLVPDEAILSDQIRKIVMTVGPDNKVAPKVVELGQLDDGLRVIKSGLSPDDQVIVNGLMRARPGSEVIPQTVDPTKPASPPDPAAKPAAGK
ncbi:efflux RND transporter periplasmic adaptor subunit [Hansschlegelia sp.]|uniref:efflux RND transporter periplasmic adaptor subunit n=1 Tax=Hansschlegelia sp. TaxID=2041892 RepID=UPI002B72E744|nr:efflux RND transporter periplasmic adaptor subunit [Hansschlegelia sp.]HVI27106.1 efflux RND transporter periplasmic adaptor subunit [Hansschlegelia sp.]